jgi:hypothetical protein
LGLPWGLTVKLCQFKYWYCIDTNSMAAPIISLLAKEISIWFHTV